MEVERTWIHYLCYALIVVIALLGNSLVIYVLFSRRKSFLNKPYGIFILNLAIVDFITAISLIFSRFLYSPLPPTSSQIAAKMFCLFVWSAAFPFIMGNISVFTCVLLTIERWIAVVKPETYCSLNTKHAVVSVVFVWIIGIGINVMTFFRINYDRDQHACSWTPTPFAAEELPWIDLTVQSIIPYTTMIVLYAHIYFRLKNMPQISSNPQLKKVTVVALIACSALIVGWLPSRITFMLSKFGYLHPNGIFHTSFVILSFCNSCVNPGLYGMCSSKFRAEYKVVFKKVLALCATSTTTSDSYAVPDTADTPLPPVNSIVSPEIYEKTVF